MTEIRVTTGCPDCATPLGQPHHPGCDVARCTVCGYQRISCAGAGANEGWDEVWDATEWPYDQFGRDLRFTGHHQPASA